ncbi:CapA family protein [Paenactinomyces guangxiensis]|uniref:CapA family protein n=1 Tax=Paenactinomyces guangxiensis TaxID=1490290 RepID=A0A7W2A8A6_9BACL|nr:CapA family protein [Paenactinomyces guangxiensis]MBA4494450.1 CapA family protein [Paenactinomyces guangxiensis]MBH8591495.1 CapA family protein [Paenactinomyces guangxiensis]
MKHIFSAFVFLFLLFLPFPGCAFFGDLTTPSLDQPTKTEPSKDKAEAEAPKTVRVAAFGDIMLHSPQIRAGIQADGSYDFRSFFKEVKPYIQSADIAIGNLETTLAGRSKPFSGYPQFNSPDELVHALKDAGVDVVSTANNHAMDTGEKGVIRTYRTVNKSGIQTTGTAPTHEEKKAAILKKNGITIAFLAYTQSTNGLPVPKDKPYLINRINTTQIAQDVKETKKQGTDFVCVSLHFGNEYQRHPNDYQLKIARQVLEDGADVILGSHPHVLQPMEKVTINGKEKFIIYSMGNFISNQQDPYTDEGVILYFDLEKDPAKKQTSLKNVSFLPTYVHKYYQNGKRQYVVIPTETKQPGTLPDYPGLTPAKWRMTWNHTQQLMKEKGTFPTFSLNRD